MEDKLEDCEKVILFSKNRLDFCFKNFPAHSKQIVLSCLCRIIFAVIFTVYLLNDNFMIWHRKCNLHKLCSMFALDMPYCFFGLCKFL